MLRLVKSPFLNVLSMILYLSSCLIHTCLSFLQTASQLDSIGSGHVDIKYEDYPFTPTSMASQNSWCALSQAWAASTSKTAVLTPRTHRGVVMEDVSPPCKYSSWLWSCGETLLQYLMATCVQAYLNRGHLICLPYNINTPACNRQAPRRSPGHTLA